MTMAVGKSKARDAEARAKQDSETTQELDAGGQGREPLTEDLRTPLPPVACGFSVAVSRQSAPATCSSQTHDAHLNLTEGVA